MTKQEFKYCSGRFRSYTFPDGSNMVHHTNVQWTPLSDGEQYVRIGVRDPLYWPHDIKTGAKLDDILKRKKNNKNS